MSKLNHDVRSDMVNVNVVFANKGSGDVYSFSRVPCPDELVFISGEEGKVIEVIHMANVDPTCKVVARILVKGSLEKIVRTTYTRSAKVTHEN